MTSNTVDDTRPLLLAQIDRQLKDITERLVADVAAAKAGAVPEGFVLYHLRNLQGEPLKDTQTDAVGISLDDILESEGFAFLRAEAKDLNVAVRLDRHFYSSHPNAVRIFRVLVDGW